MALSLLLLTVMIVHSMHNAELDHLIGAVSHIPSYYPSKYHPIITVETEEELYKLIAYTSNALFQHYENGTLFDHHTGVTIQYREKSLLLFNVTTTKVEPFFIAEAIVNILHKWYEYRFYERGHLSLGTQFDRRYRDITELTLQLRTFREIYDMNSFETLSKSLDVLDGYFRKFTGFKCTVLQRYLLHNEYVAFISDQKLKIVDKVGEGSQAIVYRVKSELNQQIYALKLFKNIYRESRLKNDCKTEEAVMKKINRINDAFEVSGWNELNQTVNVPRLIVCTDDGVEISCSKHQALLMEFIQKKSRSSWKENVVKAAKEMYLQLQPTIEILARNGLAHTDMNFNNILQDVCVCV